MYDESVDVVNAREVRTSSDSESGAEVTPAPATAAAMSGKFPPPARPRGPATALQTDSETDSEPDGFLQKNITTSDSRPPLTRLLSKPSMDTRGQSKEEKIKPFEKNKPIDSSENSDTDSNEEGGEGVLRAAGGGGAAAAGGIVLPPGGAYDPNKFADLKVSSELDNLFQHILKYTPQKIEMEYKLLPFIPDYVPAVGDIDAFIKVETPQRSARVAAAPAAALAQHIDHLGLTVLDEPAAEQSDSALLHLQLRAVSKTTSAQSTMVVKKIENAEKNPKAIDRWIKDVSELHLSKPAPNVTYTVKMPDLDTLMEEWPEAMEETLNEVGFPPSSMDCSMIEYVDLVCALFDIPVAENSLNARIQALHVFFTLYMAVKNSQLYAERQKEEKSAAE